MFYPVSLKPEVIYGLRPLAIEPTIEGYVLRANAKLIADRHQSKPPFWGWVLGSVFFVLIAPALLFFLILGYGLLALSPFVRLNWEALNHYKTQPEPLENHGGFLVLTVFLFFVAYGILNFFLPKAYLWGFLGIGLYGFFVYLLFGIVYWSIKLLTDESIRRRFGFGLSLAPLEVVFSQYPPQVGAPGDRLIIRRSLMPPAWLGPLQCREFPPKSTLKAEVLCIERVSYTQGTDTVTEFAPVYGQPLDLSSLTHGSSQVYCYGDLAIPPTLSPSFEGKFNQIRWLLKITEQYDPLFPQRETYLTFVVDG